MRLDKWRGRFLSAYILEYIIQHTFGILNTQAAHYIHAVETIS